MSSLLPPDRNLEDYRELREALARLLVEYKDAKTPKEKHEGLQQYRTALKRFAERASSR